MEGRILMRRAVAFLAGVVVCLGAVHEARAAATLMTGLGGPQGYGTSCMPANDDGSWPAGAPGLDLTPAFPTGLHFYTGSYTTGWINNNGSLSFKSAISTYTPDAFPGAPQPMIAPYWADVDTRITGTTCNAAGYPSGGGYPAGATCADPATDGVWWSLTPGQMVVTWDQVGFYSCHETPVMSFQMILTSAGCGFTAPDGGASGIDFDIEFRYAVCGWEAGDASGGSGGFCPAGSVGTTCTPAQAGFDSAETPDNDYASLPMSRQAGISTELCTGSNLTPPQPGVWRFSVRNGAVECPNAGQPCVTGQPGICSQGQIQCTAGGTQTCVALTGPQPSQCNGLDNNCDGMIDTGPCPMGDVCSGAQCVPACSEGTCPQNWSCQSSNICIENDCIGVTCPTGADGGVAERCVDGKCVAACSGIVCPIGQVCRVGTCVDPCSGLNCGTGEVCENGLCVPTCQCNPCPAGQTCESSGKCVANDCVSANCDAGTTCEADAGGACIDDCTGAICPANQICQGGNCVPHVTVPDAGMGLMAPDGGFGNPGGSDASAHDGSVADGSDMDGGGTFGEGGSKGGCGCRLATGTGERAGAGLGLGLAALALLRRRRNRRGDDA